MHARCGVRRRPKMRPRRSMTAETHTPTATETELRSQPTTWRRALEALPAEQGKLPRPGERVLVIGCGTSWFMAMAYAALREAAGQGVTDAVTATERSEERRVGEERGAGGARTA